VSHKRGCLVISIENSFSEDSRGANRQRIPGLSRGIGTTVLKGLAEKYNGRFSAEAEGGSYRTQLVLNEMK